MGYESCTEVCIKKLDEIGKNIEEFVKEKENLANLEVESTTPTLEYLEYKLDIKNYYDKMIKSLYIATGNPGYLHEDGIPIPDDVNISLANGLESIRKVSND